MAFTRTSIQAALNEAFNENKSLGSIKTDDINEAQQMNEAEMDKGFMKEWERNCKVLITHLEHEQKSSKLGAHKGTVKKMIDTLQTVKGYPELMGDLFGTN
tara:strand:- start:191 stop:493 length:303 start_codon:yes stop_codon:yes gene_type:complete